MTDTTIDPTDTSRPRPLRIYAASSAALLVVIGALPLVGVPISAMAVGGLTVIFGALGPLATILLGEQKVTPLSNPVNAQGVPLVAKAAPLSYTDGNTPSVGSDGIAQHARGDNL